MNRLFKYFLISLYFLLLSCNTGSKKPLVVFVPDIVHQFPAENEAQATALYEKILEEGPSGIQEVCDMRHLSDQESGVAATFALSGMSSYLAKGDREKQRRMYESALLTALAADSTVEGKSFLISQLQLTGKAESIAPLSALLSDEDLCEPASRALLSIDPLAAETAFLAAFPKLDWGQQSIIIQALGEIPSGKAVPQLLPLAEHWHQDVRMSSIAALANIGAPGAKEALRKAWQTAKGFEKASTTAAYLKFAGHLAAVEDFTSIAAICREVIADSSTNNALHASTLAILVNHSDDGAIPDIDHAITSGDTDLRAAALRLVEQHPSEKLAAYWLEKQANLSPEIRADVLQMLGRRNDAAAQTIILEALSSDEKQVRIAAFRAALAQGNIELLPKILGSLQKSVSEEEIDAAKTQLAIFPTSALLPPLLETLPNSPPAAQIMVLELLADRQLVSEKAQVYTMLENENRQVRIAALRALESLADSSDIPPLTEALLNAKSKVEQNAAKKTLVVTAQKLNVQNQTAHLLDRFKAVDQQEKIRLLSAIGRIGGYVALPSVIAAKESGDADISDAAIRSLADWPQPAAMPELLDLAKNAPKKVHRVLALRGFVRLISADSSLSPQAATDKYRQAMALAENDGEKRQVLSGLSRLPSLETLAMAETYLAEPALKTDAAAAMLTIAAALETTNAKAAKTAAEKAFSAVPDNDLLAEQANALIQQIERFEDFLLDWEVSGPYQREEVSLFDYPFAPETTAPQQANWQQIPLTFGATAAWRISLDKALGGDTRVAYLRCEVYSPEKQAARMELGSDDAVKVWLNGKLIHGNNASRGVGIGDDIFEIELAKGWNKLLLKVINQGGGWGACVRIRNLEGGKLPGLASRAGGNMQLAAAIPPGEIAQFMQASAAASAPKITIAPAKDKYDGRDDYQNKAPAGFTALFNGENLAGWKGLVANPLKRAQMDAAGLSIAQTIADDTMRAHWWVENGELRYDGKGFHHICTNEQYADFELLVDWKIEKEGDSGIYLRGSPQVQIWDPAQWPEGSGGLYNNQKNPSKPLAVADNPIGEWNRFRIIMIGEKVTIYLNNILVVDNVILENYWERDKPIYPLEQIELQAHKTPLYFRNIFIREIDAREKFSGLLFNGKDLSGWEPVGSPDSSWAAENGILYTTGKGGGWLSTVREFDNFKLSLEFRVPPDGNSGVFIRAPQYGDPAYTGFEIQALDDAAEKYANLKPWQYTGSIYAVQAPSERVTKAADEWQQMEITCDGPAVQVILNGVKIIDTSLIDHQSKTKKSPGIKRRNGHIGLQNHGARVEYRNIHLEEL